MRLLDPAGSGSPVRRYTEERRAVEYDTTVSVAGELHVLRLPSAKRSHDRLLLLAAILLLHVLYSIHILVAMLPVHSTRRAEAAGFYY
jgi:hypothetical protein